METYNCIIIDDEFPARKLLRDYISKIPQLNLLESFDSGIPALDFINNNTVDLVFCDIQMPDLTGIDFMRSLHKKPIVVFTTAYSEFAIQGYELDVTEYLVKPFSLPRFIKAVNKSTEFIRLKRLAANITRNNQPNSITQEKKSKDYILVKADGKIHKIYYSQILFIEGALEYVNFHTKEKRVLGLYSLKALEDLLPESDFMRIHKSYIVAFNKIEEVEGNQVLVEGNKLPIGKSHRGAFFNRFGI
ncbi:MAG: LytR/AlgR family response regulator transcription factor [Flavobacteriales bacterium]